MEFKTDEILKNAIQKNKYKKQEWTKVRYIDAFLYVVAIYVSLFSIFYVINTPTFSLFYGGNGAITTSGRILTLALLSMVSYIGLYIPYLVVHIFLLYKTGKDIFNRKKEKIELQDDCLIYSYIDILNNKQKYVYKIKLEDLEKISYMEEIKKMIIVGKSTIQSYNGKTNELINEIKDDTFNIYAYFKPDILKELESKDIRIEINFC